MSKTNSARSLLMSIGGTAALMAEAIDPNTPVAKGRKRGGNAAKKAARKAARRI